VRQFSDALENPQISW